MRLPLITAIAVYVTIWWVTLFAILPLGVRSVHEGTDAPVAGQDQGAPIAPRLLMKAFWTTIVSAVVFAALLTGLPYLD